MSNDRERYIAHYQVTGANDEILYQGSVEVDHKGESAQTQESKESLETAIFYSLDVNVTKLEKK
jgi:hypothetical protein